MLRVAGFAVTVVLVCIASVDADAYEIYPRDLAGFLAAAGDLCLQDFEGISAGTDITGTSVGGIQFDGPGAPLIVVVADSTYSSGVGGPEHRLIATTPVNVLSPGGVELPFEGPLQDDDLTLTFSPPVAAFGLDFLWQSSDGAPFTFIVVRDEYGAIMFSGTPEMTDLGGPGADAGTDFWGIVSLSPAIGSVEIDEYDEGVAWPDSNIGFDTIRVSWTSPVAATTWTSIKALYR